PRGASDHARGRDAGRRRERRPDRARGAGDHGGRRAARLRRARAARLSRRRGRPHPRRHLRAARRRRRAREPGRGLGPRHHAGHLDGTEALATTHGVPSFKIFMFYGGYGLHGQAGEDEQRTFLMVGPEDHYDLAHFEFVMRAAARIRAAHPRLAEHVSVSLHCEMADILNAYTRLVQKDASLTGLAAYSAARPPHAEALARPVPAYAAPGA